MEVRKEWEGDVEENLILHWYLVQSGFFHYWTEWNEDAPHYFQLGLVDGNIGWCGLIHGLL